MNATYIAFTAAVAFTLLLVLVWRQRRRLGQKLDTAFSDMPVRQVEVAGWTWRYHLSGRGPYLLLVHGIGANLYCWRFILPLINPRFTVLAVDLPGFGGSSKPTNARYGLDEQAERLQAFLKFQGITQTYVVGNSMGGNIALWLALTAPKLIAGTAVIAPATSPKLVPLKVEPWLWMSAPLAQILGRGAIGWAHKRTVSRKDLVGADRVEETFRTYGGNASAVRSFLLATEAIRDIRLGQRLSQLKTPVLILWGSKDKLVSRRVIDDLEARLPLHESYVHVGGGHHLQEDQPEWVAEKIDAFFGVNTD